MATIGDPLADVGYTMLYWGTKDRPPIHPSQAVRRPARHVHGRRVAEHYAVVSGRPVEHVVFYVVLAAFKLTIIGAGNVARGPSWRRGSAHGGSGHAARAVGARPLEASLIRLPFRSWICDRSWRSRLPP